MNLGFVLGQIIHGYLRAVEISSRRNGPNRFQGPLAVPLLAVLIKLLKTKRLEIVVLNQRYVDILLHVIQYTKKGLP